jgi:hypothetical protein
MQFSLILGSFDVISKLVNGRPHALLPSLYLRYVHYGRDPGEMLTDMTVKYKETFEYLPCLSKSILVQ